MRTSEMGFNNANPSATAVAKRYMKMAMGHTAKVVDRLFRGNDAMVLFDNELAVVLTVIDDVWEVVNETDIEDFNRNK